MVKVNDLEYRLLGFSIGPEIKYELEMDDERVAVNRLLELGLIEKKQVGLDIIFQATKKGEKVWRTQF